MKHLIKISLLISIVLGLCGGGLGVAQSIPNPVVVYAPDSIKLMGKGDFGGTDSDQGKTYYYNLNVGDNYKFIIRVNSHTGSTIRGKVIAFLKDVNPANETAGNRAMHFVSAEAGQIAFYSRSVTNTRTRKLASVQTSGYPSWLYIEKKGDSVITKYSLNSASTPINNISWASLGRYGNAFLGWQNIKRGIGVCSGSNSYSSANISKFTVQPTGGVVQPTTIQGIADGQIIAYWNAFGNLRPVKARIFANKLWVTDAAGVLDNYFFVRGGNFLSRTDVTLQNSFSASKIQYFEGTTGLGGLAPPPTFTTPSGYRIGTNTAISSDGTPYYEPIQTLPNCAGNRFSILSATQQSGVAKGEYIFDAINASKHRWSLYYGTTFIASDTVTATSSRIVFNIPASVNSGNYTLKVDIQNCTATDSRAFAYTKPDGGIVSAPTIASNPNPATVGSNIALTSANCSFTVDWYKNGTFQASGQSYAITSAVLNDVYSAKCKSGANSSSFSNEIVIVDVAVNGVASVNTLVDINLPAETMWNRFQPDLIPDFEPAKSIDPKSGQLLPNKWFIWHSPYRNLFGNDEYSRMLKMSKKGITAWNISKLPTPPYSNELKSIITPNRIVSESYGLGAINGLHPEEQNWTNWINWAKNGVANSATYGAVFENGKYNPLLTINDYENAHTNLGTQTSSNYHTVAFNSMTDISTNFAGFQYGVAVSTLGYYISGLYNGSNNVWALPADNNVPASFVGKSSAQNNRVVGINEITYTIESILPEGYQVKDQNNQNWFTLKHFGKELDNNYSGGQLDQCNAQHWATNVGVGVEAVVNVHKSYPNGGQYFIAQLKQGNETDAGCHYDERYKQFRDNKYANYLNRYAVTNIKDKYDNNGNKIGTEEYLAMTGSEYITNFIAEGQVMTAFFCGAKGINLWNSDFTDVAIPKTKVGNPRRGARYDDVNYGNRDLESYLYTLKALWRLNQKVDLGNGSSYSFNEICDGTEIYLNQSTKVVYPGSLTITQLRALDWQILKKSPVRAVVNVAKNVVFVLAFQAYGVEQSQITFKLTDYGANISKVIDVPSGKIIVKAYPLTGGVVDGGTVQAPVINSNPTNPTAGTSVTFSTSSQCSGTIKWFSGDAQMSSGVSYTVANPVANSAYTATCTVNGVSSAGSNVITVANAPPVSGVTITEPNKSQYFFSDGHAPSYYSNINNLPAIITQTSPSHYDEANECVIISNANVKYVINLRRGGHVCGAYRIGSTFNYIYNGYDGGFQVGIDMHQKPDTQYSQGGKNSADCQDDAGYNVTHGGTYTNGNGFSYTQTLIDYHPVGTNGYYIKFRPIFYTLNPGEFAKNYIEVTYYLIGDVLKADYVYTSFRDDNQINTGFGFVGQSVPACFLNNQLTRFKSYTGSSPWTNGNLTDVLIPTSGGCATPGTSNSPEHWGFAYNPNTNLGFGVMNLTNLASDAGIVYKQCEVNAGNPPGTEFNGGFTYVSPTLSMQNFTSGTFTFNTTAYMMVGTDTQVRSQFKTISGN